MADCVGVLMLSLFFLAGNLLFLASIPLGIYFISSVNDSYKDYVTLALFITMQILFLCLVYSLAVS